MTEPSASLDAAVLDHVGIDLDAARALVERAQQAVDDAGLPGAQLAVALDGQVVVDVALGAATSTDRFVIFSGGGVNIKFAEAVYNGIPLLASTFAARGLPIQPDPGIVLLDHPGEWIDFLTSERARELQNRDLPASLARPFSIQLQIEPTQTFFRDIIQ